MTMLDPIALLKALADETRLKIIGLLVQETHSAEELSAMLALRPSTISHHLSRLANVGLVSVSADGYYKLYRLETSLLEALALEFFSTEMISRFAEEVDKSAFERDVIAEHTFADGSLKSFPSQARKRRVILQHLANKFDPEERYHEDEIMQILSTQHDDAKMLHRNLIASGLLEIEKGTYRRTPAPNQG